MQASSPDYGIAITEYVNIKNMNAYLELVISCNGRFIQNPMSFKTNKEFYNVLCVVGFDSSDDYSRFSHDWNRINTPILEVDNRGWFSTKFNNMKVFFNSLIG